MPFPQLQIHRGYWRSGVRENTQQAFIAAKRLGAEMVELDVQLSRDKVPVIFHDRTLKRLFHIDEKVTSTLFDDLKALNIASLAQILKSEEVPRYLNIELKTKSLFCFSLVNKVIQELQKTHKKKIMVSSFNPLCLFWTKLLSPQLPRALIVGKKSLIRSFRFKIYQILAAPQYLNVHFDLIDDPVTRDLIITKKLPVIIWTVNESDKAQFYLKRGAAGIISDEALKLS